MAKPATAPSAPADMIRRFLDAFNSGDLDALVSLYEPDAVFVPAPGQTARGAAEIRAAFASFLGGSLQMDAKTELVLEGPDGIAVSSSRWCLSGVGSDGKPVDAEGKSIEVQRRQPDGTWLYISDNPFAM